MAGYDMPGDAALEPKPPVVTTSRAVWQGGLRFEAGPPPRTHLIDARGTDAPSPVHTLLNALATCTGADVVDYIAKRRTPLDRFEVDVVATRRGEHPRRVLAIELLFTIDGATIEADHAERAIKLSFERYCTVAASLSGDIRATTILVLNGTRRPPVTQPMFATRGR